MRGGEGNVGRGGRAVRRNASRGIGIEEGEVATIHRVDKQIAASIDRSRKPAVAVGVKVAHNNSIPVGVVEESVEVGEVTRRAR